MGDVIRFPLRPKPRPVNTFDEAREALLRAIFPPNWPETDCRPADSESPETPA